MTLIRHDISRRAVLAAGAAALAAAAPVSQAATRSHQTFGLRVARIGLAAPTPDLHTTSLALRGVAVDVLTPGFDDSAANEAFHVASLAGHVVMLALHRHDVTDLNHRARAQLLANGDLGPAVLTVDELELIST